MSRLFALALAALCVQASAASTDERRVTLAQLFPASEASALSRTLPPDRELIYRVRQPAAGVRGVLVYVSATSSGELPPGWADVLDREQLLYIAADDFGNSRPTAQRILAALAAERLARELGATDARRRYIAGMSGGGRVASQLITHFPQAFAGALCIAGADFFLPQDAALRDVLVSRRLVFMTGNRDFNQREIRRVSRRYLQAGVTRQLLLDIPGFAHQRPDGGQLAQALAFLDAD